MGSPPLPAFLLAHLDRIAKAERFQSYTLSHGAGSKTGDGFMSDMVAVTIAGPRRQTAAAGAAVSGDQLALICKLLPGSTVRQEQFKSKMIFEREVLMYDTVLPMLRKFQAENGLSETGGDGFFAYPHCYAAVADQATNEYVIIMRDLRANGFELWPKCTPMPFKQASLLFEQLGRLHGVSYALRDRRPDLFDAHIRPLGDQLGVMFEAMRAMCESSYDQALRHLREPEHLRVMRLVRENWVEIVRECNESDKAKPFETMVHGDCWNNNMMFAGDQKICLLDWQISKCVSPVLDLAYFLCSSTDKAMRDPHYDQLLRTYHTNLAAVVRACGADIAKVLPFEQLQQQLRQFGRYGVVMAPILLQVIVSDASQLANMDEMALQLSQANSAEMQKEVEIAQFDEATVLLYRKRLGDVIDDALRLGWF